MLYRVVNSHQEMGYSVSLRKEVQIRKATEVSWALLRDLGLSIRWCLKSAGLFEKESLRGARCSVFKGSGEGVLCDLGSFLLLLMTIRS